jgi:Rod binding domain-containing protein
LEKGDNALTAPTTPGRRVAVIDKSKVDPELVKAAEGMESMFLNYMMNVMRETVPKNDMDLHSPATDVYQGMLDHEYSQKAVKAGGVGLADQIIAYWESQRYNQPKEQAAPEVVGTGGTHAGQPVRK